MSFVMAELEFRKELISLKDMSAKPQIERFTTQMSIEKKFNEKLFCVLVNWSQLANSFKNS